MQIKLSHALLVFIISAAALNADETLLPIKKVSLFSSGVGYFERSGEVKGSVNLTLPFENTAMDDALKSLIVHDSATNAPLVSYASEDLQKMLSELKVNLSGNPSIAQILHSLKGAELEIYAPDKIVGKIIGTQVNREKNYDELSLLVNGNIRVVSLSNVTSYRFTDAQLSHDLARALELMLNSKQNIKNINVYLPSNKKRTVSISYVIPTSVWKATYRLDLSDKKPFLQGWAIIDNAGDTEWKDVELSLIVGRPVSFTQPLYIPYFLSRPSLPLSIAGFAEAKSYESGYVSLKANKQAISYAADVADEEAYMEVQATDDFYMPPEPNYNIPQSKSAGEQFVFTLKNPITLERRQSAMVPFVQSNIKARKVSIFTHVPQGSSVNPSLGAELTNDSGLKLPAGPIAIYDGNTFTGDALIEFFGQNEKRLISYGDDLAVKGTLSHSAKTIFDSVKISKGVITTTKKIIYEKIYTLKNSGKTDKNIILEHPFAAGATLISPSKYAEKTSSAYRFDFKLPSNKEIAYVVKEEKPDKNSVHILDMDYTTIAMFSDNKDFPSSVKKALKEAARLMNAIADEENRLDEAQSTLSSKLDEQERIRQNIVTLGNNSTHAQEYIKMLKTLDKEIEENNANIEKIRKSWQKAQMEFEKYAANLNI
ncbi:MAG: hypothetical protein LBP40_00275 [Campylobacteraceae bacterium]|jgi:hypothetical protein|nr:hypothetical protein [Campylobacteraceae bacterium]